MLEHQISTMKKFQYQLSLRNCRIIRNSFTALFWLFFGVSTVFAGQPRMLDLDQAINIALKKSYTIKSYYEQRLSAEHFFKYWQAQFKPRLDFSTSLPSWNESVNPIEQVDGLPVYNSTGLLTYSSNLKFTYTIPTGGNFAFNTQLYRENLKTVLAEQDYRTLTSRLVRSSFALSFSQPIFTTNTLKEELNEARMRYEKSSSQFNRQQMDIIYRVTETFYNVYRNAREVEINRERLRNSEEAFRIAKLKLEAGRIAEVDVLSREVKVAQNRADLSESEGRLERSRDTLKQLIGMSLYDDFEIVTSLDYDIVQIGEDLAIEKALANRRELEECRLDIELDRIELERAKREREFKGSINAYYDITGVSTIEHGSTGAFLRSSLENIIDRPPNRGVTLEFSYPIFDWGRGRQQIERVKANLRSSELELQNREIDIIREIRDIVRSVEEARNRLIIQDKNQQLAQKVYRISLLSFEHGEITSQELGNEQEQLTESQHGYLDAYITYQLQLADLKRKTVWDFKTNTSYLEANFFRMER